MRVRPYDMYSKPKDGFMCVGKGGTVDGFKYYDFVYYTAGSTGKSQSTTTSIISEPRT